MLDLTATRWTAATEHERMGIAEALLRQLPQGFRLAGVRGIVATFTRDGRAFALVPGGAFTIGWDPSRWQPDDDELESFADTAGEYGIETSLVAYVAAATGRPREVTIRPMLVETVAGEIGWSRVSLDEDREAREVAAGLSKDRSPTATTLHRGGSQVRVQRLATGEVIADRADAEITHDVLVARFAAEGFRLATSDEWEVLCGAGARTLFHWGDHVPCNRYPTDRSPEEDAWRRAWVISRGTLERPAGGFPSDWEFHRDPNAFGLHIASDPYKWELVAEADRVRGGDGGMTICGGAGYFVGWLPLATAYFEDHACLRDPAEELDVGYVNARRILAL